MKIQRLHNHVLAIIMIIFFHSNPGFTQPTNFSTGSFIVNMGVTPQTQTNALYPYGLVYDLVKNYDVPVFWIINSTKVKDGIDFTYNGTSYKGGPFIIAAENRNAAVDARIAYWQTQGVVGTFSTSSFSAPVAQKISAVPRWTLDFKTGQIAQNYILNAGIPLETTNWVEPQLLNSCNDIFVMPHADPKWATHNYLIDWSNTYKGSIWSGCHAVSVLENMYNPLNPSQQANFLALNSGAAGSQALVPFGSHKDGSLPYNNNSYAGEQVMQFLGSIDNATTNGSEQIYLPAAGGGWRSTTKVSVYDATQLNVPSISPGRAAVIAYGRAYGDNNRGWVMYQGGHNLDRGNSDDIAAQRAFLNFSFMATVEKNMNLAVSGIQSVMISNQAYALSLSISQSIPTGPYNIQWSSSCGGTFSNPTALNTNYTPPLVASIQSCVITVKVTDACGRIRFFTQTITVTNGPRPPVANPDSLSTAPDCINRNPVINIPVLTNDSEPDGQPLTLSAVIGSNGTWSINPDNTIKFIPNGGFYGSTTATYTICDNTSPTALCVNSTIKITIGSTNQQPTATDDTYTILEDSIQRLNVLSNDLAGNGGGSLKLAGITVNPVYGKVSINPDNTITYLPNADNRVADSFYYKVSNGANYISIGKVKINFIADGCGAGQYQTCFPAPNPVSVTAVQDAYINSKFPTNNYGSDNFIIVDRENTEKQRSLVKFNLPSLTCDPSILPVINSATLKLYKSGGGGGDLGVDVYRATTVWDQSQATWNNSLTGTAWTTAGGDFNASLIATATVNADGLYTWNVTSLVTNWFNNPGTYPNYGILLKTTEGGGNRDPYFVSSENNSGLLKPTLEISYTIPSLCKTIPVRPTLAMPDTASTDALTPITIAVQNNDYFPVAGTNTVTIIPGSVSIGNASVSGTNILYTPLSSFNGTATLQYRIVNSTTGLADTALVSIFIEYTAPVANNDSASIYTGASTTVNVTTNDIDPQGIGISASIIGTPKFGTYSISGNSITYNAPYNFIGRDTITYKLTNALPNLCNESLAADTAYFIIIVNNRIPASGDDTTSTNPCQAIAIDVLSNDSDPEKGSISVYSVSALNPVNAGSLSTDGNLVYYTPNASYAGTSASFTYVVSDDASPQGLSAAATVIINLSPMINQPPIALNDTIEGLANAATYIDVLANDTDPEKDNLSVSLGVLLLQPLHGTISVYGNNLIKYEPILGFTGIDSFQYRLSDSHFGISGGVCTDVSQSRVATVYIVISSSYIVLSQNSVFLSGRKERDGNHLQWYVDQPVAAKIELEKSSDNINYRTIKTFYHGLHENVKYEWKDEAITADHFYRVKIISDYNPVIYSKTLLLKNRTAKKEMIVYPSPFSDQIKVKLYSEDKGPANISVYDMKGTKVAERKYPVIRGMNVISIASLEKLPAGFYLVTVEQNMKMESKMISKK
jgi:Bacterial Ig domain/Disaggregatase related repeat/Secretion system C-terminal sorting domain